MAAFVSRALLLLSIRAAEAMIILSDDSDLEEALNGTETWVFCAAQWMECQCEGRVRWGVDGHWTYLPAQAEAVKCTVDALGDAKPGDDSKHCECGATPGTDFFQRLSPAVVPSLGSELQRHASCDLFESLAEGGMQWDKTQWESVAGLCGKPLVEVESGDRALSVDELRALMDAWVDPRFKDNYKRHYDENGWLEEGFLNFVGNSPTGHKFAKMNEQLVRSVHLFSKRPIVVVHYGMAPPAEWDPVKFPNMILIHAAPLPGKGLRFNWNKMRAMLMSRIKTGIQLDSDQFVAPGVDAMFQRTAQEVNRAYPRPILPVHFLSHKGPSEGGAWWPRYCNGDLSKSKCTGMTARWGHAHPTWTFHGLPFVGRWLQREFLDETLPARPGRPNSLLRVTDVPEDEDLLNLGTWEESGTKQWCKFDISDPENFETLLADGANTGAPCKGVGCIDIGADDRFHPAGAAQAFYTAHHAVDPANSEDIITRLAARHAEGTLPPPILYKERFFRDGKHLKKHHPEVVCLI